MKNNNFVKFSIDDLKFTIGFEVSHFADQTHIDIKALANVPHGADGRKDLSIQVDSFEEALKRCRKMAQLYVLAKRDLHDIKIELLEDSFYEVV